jgi:phospholipase/carboxylesterase
MATFSLIHRLQPARRGAPPHPGLLLLHGRGSDENDLLALAAELDPRLFTVSARAPFRFPWGGYMWYDLEANMAGRPSQESIQASLDRLRRFLDEIVAAYPIDQQRLYIGGFSMGAAMAAALALLEPKRLAGAIVLSGYLPLHTALPYRPQEAAGHPFFQAHGTFDPVLPVQLARLTRDYLTQTPVDLTYREYPIGHEVGDQELRDLAAWLTSVLDVQEPETQPTA